MREGNIAKKLFVIKFNSKIGLDIFTNLFYYCVSTQNCLHCSFFATTLTPKLSPLFQLHHVH